MNISAYIIPVLFVLVFIYSLFKKQRPYNDFADGATQALTLVKNIFPYMIAIFLMVQLFRVSGLSVIFAKAFSPVLYVFGIPKELSELVLLKPFSGSGSLAVLNEIYLTYGVDSYISRCASVVMSASETVFYISALYFSKLKGKGLFKGIAISLLAGNIGAGVGCLVCRFI